MSRIPFSISILFVIYFVANIDYGQGVHLEKINGHKLHFGHAPFWEPVTESWYYTDLLAPTSGPQIFRLDRKTQIEYSANVKDFNGGVAFIVPIVGQPNRFAIGIELRVICIEWDGFSNVAKQCGEITSLSPGADNNLLMHYGAADPLGHLYIKPFNKILCGASAAEAAIYKVIRNGVNKPEVENLISPTGFIWNKSTDKFYYVDLCRPTINECIWNPSTSDISSCRVVFTLDIPNSPMHSLTVDRSGNLYFFLFNQGWLYKVSPVTGEVLWKHKFEIPTLINLAFGGPLLDDLMITTASVVLNPANGNMSTPATLPANAGHTFIMKNSISGFTANAYNKNV